MSVLKEHEIRYAVERGPGLIRGEMGIYWEWWVDSQMVGVEANDYRNKNEIYFGYKGVPETRGTRINEFDVYDDALDKGYYSLKVPDSYTRSC